MTELFADRYEITDLLSDEGRNVVYVAFDTHQKQQVALKVFAPGASTILAYGEASILTALEGEHVLRVYNADTFNDIPFIATRVAAMGSTERIRRPNGFLPADAVVGWIRQALVGLGACHDRGLVHRDVKPENIFLETLEFALLGDFGLVYEVDADGTVPADGTPTTMAPEMWSIDRGSRLSDIYSMGVTAYRLLAGRWPLDFASGEDAKAIVPGGGFTRLRDVAPQVSRRLAERIERAMALDPSDRYQSWHEMHAALGDHDLVRSAWRRETSHAGHQRCWTEVRSAGGALRSVCVIPVDADTVDIEVRHAAGARRRLGNAGRTAVNRRRLAVALREVFDTLSL